MGRQNVPIGHLLTRTCA